MRLPSILTIAERLTLPVITARQIRAQFEIARKDVNMTDIVMEKCDKIMNGYGVEALRGPDFRHYWGEIEVLYVNMGDSYAQTVYYDARSRSFRVGSCGDLIESDEKRFT